MFTLFLLLAASICVSSSTSSPPIDANCTCTIQQILNQIEIWRRDRKKALATSLFGIMRRPFVTLTYAQSLDGRIALKNETSGCEGNICGSSSNLQLSGFESRRLSHALRSIHDGIMVGGWTFSVDNPRLTNRLWLPSLHQPRPIILDTHLINFYKLFGTSPEEMTASSCRCTRPIFCCSHEAAQTFHRHFRKTDKFDILPSKLDINGRLDLRSLLRSLVNHGITSLMVEGGAKVLSSFIQSRDLVDCMCITITPKLLGDYYGLPSFTSVDSDENCSITPSADKYVLDLNYISRFFELGTDCAFLTRGPRIKNS